MKMKLLQDILKGLEELERHEQKKVQSKPSAPKDGMPFKLHGSLIKVNRETSVKGNPPGKTSDVTRTIPKTYENYGVKNSPYEFDPDDVVFLGVKRDSDHHHSKLRDLSTVSRYDPSLAHKILTLS